MWVWGCAPLGIWNVFVSFLLSKAEPQELRIIQSLRWVTVVIMSASWKTNSKLSTILLIKSDGFWIKQHANMTVNATKKNTSIGGLFKALKVLLHCWEVILFEKIFLTHEPEEVNDEKIGLREESWVDYLLWKQGTALSQHWLLLTMKTHISITITEWLSIALNQL